MPRIADYVPPLLDRRMKERGIIHLQALAGLMGVEKSVLTQQISGENRMSLKNALALLDVLGYSTDTAPLKLLAEIQENFDKRREG